MLDNNHLLTKAQCSLSQVSLAYTSYTVVLFSCLVRHCDQQYADGSNWGQLKRKWTEPKTHIV